MLADVGQESQSWSFVLSTGHVQGLFITWLWLLVSSPKCFCSIWPSNTQSVCFDTYCIVIVLTSGHAAGWINTSVSCLVKLQLLFLATLTLVSLVLWESIKTPTWLQLSWLVDRHGFFYERKFIQHIVFRTLLTSVKHNTKKNYLQYYKLVYYRWPYQWPMGFSTFSLMVIDLIHKLHHYRQSWSSPWQIILNVSIEVRMSLLRALTTSVFLYGCET